MRRARVRVRSGQRTLFMGGARGRFPEYENGSLAIFYPLFPELVDTTLFWTPCEVEQHPFEDA